MENKKHKRYETTVAALAHTIAEVIEEKFNGEYDFILLVTPKIEPGFNALISNLDHGDQITVMETKLMEYKKRCTDCSTPSVTH